MSGDEWVSLRVDGQPMRAFVARPAGAGTHPALLLIMEALGVNEQIRGVARRWAAQGFLCIAPDVFHRVEPAFETEAFDVERFMPLVKSLTTEGTLADMRAAHDWLLAQGDVDRARICALGFCLGGRATFIANSELPLAAAVSYYGGGIAPALLDRASRLHGPHLFFWGGKDAGIPPEQHRAVIDAVRAAGKIFADVEFSDANHGFFSEHLPQRYNRAAAEESFAIATRFLADHANAGVAVSSRHGAQ